MTQKSDFFTRLVNWFSTSGKDKPAINKPEGVKDAFSRLMNTISG